MNTEDLVRETLHRQAARITEDAGRAATILAAAGVRARQRSRWLPTRDWLPSKDWLLPAAAAITVALVVGGTVLTIGNAKHGSYATDGISAAVGNSAQPSVSASAPLSSSATPSASETPVSAMTGSSASGQAEPSASYPGNSSTFIAQAEQQLAVLMRRVQVPPGAQETVSSTGVGADPFIEQTRTWSAKGTVEVAAAFLQTHLPTGTTFDGFGGPPGVKEIYVHVPTSGAGVPTHLTLEVRPDPSGGVTIRAIGVAELVPLRPIESFIASDARKVVLTLTRGGKTPPYKVTTTLSAADAPTLAKTLNDLKIGHNGAVEGVCAVASNDSFSPWYESITFNDATTRWVISVNEGGCATIFVKSGTDTVYLAYSQPLYDKILKLGGVSNAP